MNDPKSIRAWYQVAPHRHRLLLRAFWKLWPQYRHAIEEAMRGN